MKIKNQFKILIAGIIFIPMLMAITLPLYHYISSPQRYLMKGYKQIRQLDNVNLNENEWVAIEKKIKELPPNVQTAILYEDTFIISNIPELPVNSSLDFYEIFTLINSSNNKYDYQFQSLQHEPQLTPNGMARQKMGHVFAITRSRVPGAKKPLINRLYIPVFFGIIIFELFVVILVILTSRNITSSITILEKNTQKIANGELDAKFDIPSTNKLNEITSLTKSLEKMRESLKDDQQRRCKFIMGISHDLRTPVSLIKGYSEAITDGVVNNPKQIINSIEIIQTKADQLESMINDLINYVKLDNKEWLSSLVNIQFLPFIKEFATSMNQMSEVYKRCISIDIDLPPDVMVPMDKALVNRALENITSNAFRYTKDGDTIALKVFKINESIKEGHKAEIHISISDTGSGMAEEDLSHIYDLFYRGTNSRREQGMGIGLSNVKTIVDAHGWDLEVESKLNVGTTFTIIIPYDDRKKIDNTTLEEEPDGFVKAPHQEEDDSENSASYSYI